MRVQSLGIAVLYAALAACVSPTANEPQVVELRTDRSSYGLGDTGRLTLTNQGPHAVYASLSACNMNVERWLGNTWESAGWFAEVCIMESNPIVQVGDSGARGFKVVAPPFSPLGGGEYRFHVSVFEVASLQRFEFFSPPFSVVP